MNHQIQIREILDQQEECFKKRKALEETYTNFVEPYISVNSQPLPPPVLHSGFCCTFAWVLLVLFCCRKRCRKKTP